MTLDWDSFKRSLGKYWDKSYVVYVDEEGSEIPIESSCEFQEALRVAKENKNRLKLIFYDNNTPSSQKMLLTFPESVRIFNPAENAEEPPKNNDTQSVSSTPNGKEKTCCCNGDVPPEWFTHYMKKFKKNLLHEVRSNILEGIVTSLKKEHKPTRMKSNSVYLFGEKNESLLSPVTAHSKKKKRVSDKDGVDILEQRDPKLSKKLEKLQLSKSEKLEKLDNKTKFSLEEKKKLLEKRRFSKSKLEKNSSVASEKKNITKLSASFLKNDVCLCLVPGGMFTLTLHIKNDGNASWCSPRLECFDTASLYPNESYVNLPKLSPNESCSITLRGRASHLLGLKHFKCKIMDEQEKISPEFTCWANVNRFEHYEKYCDVSVDLKEYETVSAPPANAVDKLAEIEKDELIITSKKKIEENIMEIEKRLQYIDLLTSSEPNVKKTPGKTKKVSTKNPESQIEGCDVLKDLEVKEKLEEEEILIGVDCLRLASDGKEPITNPKSDEKQRVEVDKELESSSDSELSVIFMSEEEDENFHIISLLSKSPSPAESVNEDKNSANVETEDKHPTYQEQSESITHEPVQPMITIAIKKKVDKETNTPENLSLDEFSLTWNKHSPFGEEIQISKPKKMKSKSTKYHFTTANLTQPTFTASPDGFYTERPSKFTFTGENKEKATQNVFEFNLVSGKEGKNQPNDLKGKTIPKTDASGRIIYAVTHMGHCLPVGDLFESGEPSDENGQGKQKRFNEIPSVNILPYVLMNGASIAFNTAKSVINNLHSAFVTEGKTELGKPACEDKKKVSMENMFKLYEMGFCDLQINRKLLLIHDNDISKVIEELVKLEEDASK